MTARHLPAPESIDISTLLPQRPPFVMVGRLTRFDENTTATSTLISADMLFVADGHLSASGLIENMAQTCAARIGYVNRYMRLRGIQIGYIGAIRSLTVSSLPAVGDTLVTEIECVEEVFGMTLVEARSYVGGKQVASGTMKIALIDDEDNTSIH